MHLPLAMDFRGFVLVDLFRSGIINALLVSFYTILHIGCLFQHLVFILL